MEKVFEQQLFIWSLFAAGFLMPPLFLLFIPLALRAAWRGFSSEYEEVVAYWQEKLNKKSGLCGAHTCSSMERAALKPATEMV
ncbi:hypothetical protein [Hydrogenimonas sp.]